MSTAADRRASRSANHALKAARRQELDGSGPVREERGPAANPGATGTFGLFGEVLLVGLLIAAASVLVITFPAALAAGVAHLRRYVAAEDTKLSLFWADLRRALPGGTAVGAGVLVLTLLLVLDIDLARSGFLPGGAVIEAVGWVGLIALAAGLLAAAGAWTHERGWLGSIRAVPGMVRSDVAGALYLLATAGFVAVLTWVLLPLLVPALGCAALAVVAIPARPRRTNRGDH